MQKTNSSKNIIGVPVNLKNECYDDTEGEDISPEKIQEINLC